jgi:homoserine O-acetyltransferase
MDWSPDTFSLGDLQLEPGGVIPDARLRYATAGVLNAAGDNAVLLPSHYMADHTGYDWLVGPGLALSPDRFFLVATELFGNGHSSSPSNTPSPYDGPRFPLVTIRDNVAACHRLLTSLGVQRLHAVVGFSMGAQQAFQWAVSHPEFVSRVVATAGTAKTYGHGWVRLEGQLAALRADAAFAAGDYTSPPLVGLRAYGTVWAAWLYSQEWWRRELWHEQGVDTAAAMVEAIADHFAASDANDHIAHVRTWQAHNVGTTPGFDSLPDALRSIRCPVLSMPAATDLYFPIGDAKYESEFIPDVRLEPIESLWGHPAGAGASPEDAEFLNRVIGEFVAT